MKAIIEIIKNISAKVDKCLQESKEISRRAELSKQYSQSSVTLGNQVSNKASVIGNDILLSMDLGVSNYESVIQCSSDTLLSMELQITIVENQALILENQRLILEKLSEDKSGVN